MTDQTINVSSERESDTNLPRWIVPAGFIIGCLFLIAVLGISLAVPNPTSSQVMVLRTVLALAGAGYSMSLTGFLAVRLNLPQKGYIVAGGTLAVFVVLFFFSPAVGHSVKVNGNGNITVVGGGEGTQP